MRDRDRRRHTHTRIHTHTHAGHTGHTGKRRKKTAALSRERKKAGALLFLAVMAASFALAWAFSGQAERLLTARREAPGETEEEMTELPVYREVQGKVKLDGQVYTYDHVIESWLLIGTDGSGNETGEGEDYHGAMADFLALAVFDKTDRTYALLQLDRDTITDVTMLQADGSGYASADMQLCMAHWYGRNPEESCENTVDAVSRLLGNVKIKGYYSLGMDEIGALNHAAGGVEVTVTGDFSREDPSLVEGERVLLSDEQAVSYVRGRMSVGDGSNAGRMERQRQYLKSLTEKVREKTRESSSFINGIYRDLEEYAVTTMTGRDLSRLVKRVDQGENLGIFVLEGESEVVYADWDGKYHAEFYPDRDSIREVMEKLYHLKKQEKKEN